MTALPRNDTPASNVSIPELAISHWWRFARLVEPFTSTDGRELRIVFRGIWSHGNGPDFQNAMIAFEHAELHSGSIEIHKSSNDWYRHGHDRDPRYNDVVLHVVMSNDGLAARRADGKIVPTVVLPAGAIHPHHIQPGSWSLVGGDVCAAELAGRDPGAIRRAVQALGDQRLGQKSARIEALLTSHEPGEVLYRELLDTLGYSANREPMKQIAGILPLKLIEPLLSSVHEHDRARLAMAAILGAAGFLPLAPALQEVAGLDSGDVAGIERFWMTHCSPWHGLRLRPTSWKLNRVRPANHPVRRLMAGALIVAGATGGLQFELLERIRSGASIDADLTTWATWNADRLLGLGRARAIVTNAVIPFALALAAHTNDDALAEDVSRAWESLPAEEPNETSRRAERQIAGSVRLGRWGARGMQGLIQLDVTLCGPRRCFECPIAHLVLDGMEPDPDGMHAI